MPPFFRLFVTIALFAFATVAAAQNHQQKLISEGPDLSGFDKGQPTNGRLSRMDKNYIVWMRKYDPARAKKIDNRLKQKNTSDERVVDLSRQLVKVHEKFVLEEKYFRDGFLSKKSLKKSRMEYYVTHDLLRYAKKKYLSDLATKYGEGSKKFKNVKEKIKNRIDTWNKKFKEFRSKRRKKLNLPDRELVGGKKFSFLVFYGSKLYKAYDAPPKPAGGGSWPGPKPGPVPPGPVPPGPKPGPKPGPGPGSGKSFPSKPADMDKRIKSACRGLGGKWRPGAPEQAKKSVETMRARLKSRLTSCRGPYAANCIKHVRIETAVWGYFRTLDVWQCSFLTYRFVASLSGDDRKLVKQETCTIQRDYLEPLQKEAIAAGAKMQTAPHQQMLASHGKTEMCNESNKPITQSNFLKPSDSASSTDKKTGITTPDKADNERPRAPARRSPASASATDMNTGETITSVGNPDGSRTVTKTDKDGNILSREKVR